MFSFDELDQFKRQSRHGLDLTSMIDIIFILLIFFMVSTTFSKVGIAIDIPESKYVANNKPEIVDIFIDISGQTFLNNQLITEDNLRQLVRNKVQNNANTHFVLNPDKQTITQDLLRVLDICKDENASQFSIAAKYKP